MRQTFICNNHKIILTEQPVLAINMYENMKSIGETLMQANRWHEALPCSGSAFEAANILLDSNLLPKYKVLTCMLQSLSSLILNFRKLRMVQQGHEIYNWALQRLNPEIKGLEDSEQETITEELDILAFEMALLDNSKTEEDYKNCILDATKNEYILH